MTHVTLQLHVALNSPNMLIDSTAKLRYSYALVDYLQTTKYKEIYLLEIARL